LSELNRREKLREGVTTNGIFTTQTIPGIVAEDGDEDEKEMQLGLVDGKKRKKGSGGEKKQKKQRQSKQKRKKKKGKKEIIIFDDYVGDEGKEENAGKAREATGFLKVCYDECSEDIKRYVFRSKSIGKEITVNRYVTVPTFVASPLPLSSSTQNNTSGSRGTDLSSPPGPPHLSIFTKSFVRNRFPARHTHGRLYSSGQFDECGETIYKQRWSCGSGWACRGGRRN
jgi:hypothetical protein